MSGTFLSLFSGIGGLDLGLERAGWRCVGQVESDPHRRGILERRFPGVPKWGDVRSVGVRLAAGEQGRAAARASGDDAEGWLPGSVDLICGGFPCQDLSVAGRRAGLQGARSSLFFEFARIVDLVRPRWLLVENVPGLLSSHGGRDFAVVLATLAELGYGVCWRVLDSRYFGVPQRRRRVFVVGHLGATSAEPFLPFLEGGEGNPQTGGAPGQDVAATLGGGSGRRGWDDSGERGGASLSGLGSDGADDNDAQAGRVVAIEAVGRKMSGGPEVGQGWRDDGTMYSLDRDSRHAVAGPLGGGNDGAGRRSEDDPNLVTVSEESGGYAWEKADAYPTLGTANGGRQQTGLRQGMAVRRLTPTECLRLQGFPDDWLGEPNEPPDGPRYAACGDAVTVPVAQYIGEALAMAENTHRASGGNE